MPSKYAKLGHVIQNYDIRKELERMDRPAPEKGGNPDITPPVFPKIWQPISSDESIIIEGNDIKDFINWNYAEKYEYKYLHDSIDYNLPINRSLAYDGWIPFTCDIPRIATGDSWIKHFDSKRWKLSTDTLDPQVMDYMYFQPRRGGVYQITVSLCIEILRNNIPLNDDWLTDLIIIVAKTPYSDIIDTDYHYMPIQKELILTGLPTPSLNLENVVAMLNRASSTVRIGDDTVNVSSAERNIIGSLACNKAMLRGTCLTYVEPNEVITIWYKMKGGFYEESGIYYNWCNDETAVRAYQIDEQFEVNWQGYNYNEQNWYLTNGANLQNIINRF